MKIHRVHVRNYRSLRDVKVELDDYSALVGANGAGKSSLLYALDWFFNGHPLALTDVHGYQEGATPAVDCVVEVTVTFGDLTRVDRNRLGQYGRGAQATFCRTWRVGERDKVVGNALQGPGFAAIRAMARVGEFRPAYQQLRREQTGLPDLGPTPARERVVGALTDWESEDSNRGRLVPVNDDDANHMFGINGPNVIRDCIRLILIPAASDISSQVADPSGRGSALNELIGAVMAEAGERATSEWLSENEAVIADLKRRVSISVETSTGVQTERVNSRLADLIPNATLRLTPTLPTWSPKTNPTVKTDVTIDGVTNDISRQGHGVQRAVMMSMFEALAPDEALLRSGHHALDGESISDSAARLQEALGSLPTMIVCIEEPEIYQHPVRARTFARTLTELSGQANVQVVVATHSPYFVRPEQFSSLRRFTLTSGSTNVSSTSAAAIEAATGVEAQKVSKIVDKRIPTEFSEGFFADAVVLVEGQTDRSVVETLASRMDLDLDARGISVIEVSSKESLRIPYEIFDALGVPAYIIADGDFEGATRRYPDDQAAREGAHENHRLATEGLVGWLRDTDGVRGALDYSFGDPSLTTFVATIWRDDLEQELTAWPSLVEALAEDDHRLRGKKNLLAYRNAVLEADLADLPISLRTTIETIAQFASSSR